MFLYGYTGDLYLEVKKIYVWITVLGVACLVLVILLAICGYYIYSNNQKIKYLHGHIKELNEKIEEQHKEEV